MAILIIAAKEQNVITTMEALRRSILQTQKYGQGPAGSKFSYDGIEYENIYDFMVKRKPGKKFLWDQGAARYGYKKEAKCQNSQRM